MAGTHRLQRFKDITYHRYTVLRLFGIACHMIMQDHARRTAALTDVTTVGGLNATPLRTPPVIPTVVLAAMVPGAVMLGLITIAGTGIRT
jgi:hypothetical protein